jgi:hypothetical protein
MLSGYSRKDKPTDQRWSFAEQRDVTKTLLARTKGMMSKYKASSSAAFANALKTDADRQKDMDDEANKEAEEQAKTDAESDKLFYGVYGDSKGMGAAAEDLKKNGGASNILAMLLKIVPIGLGIVGRLPNVAMGFKDMATSFGNIVAGLIVTILRTFIDTFQFISYFFLDGFSLIGCAIDKVMKIFGICGLIYIFHLILLIAYVILMSVCFMVDVILMTKTLFGISLVESVGMIGDLLISFDDTVYGISSFHILQYPDFIEKECFYCDLPDGSGLQRTSKAIKYDLGTMLPEKVMSPIGQFFGGVGKVFSIFSI